jgi:hypothetical protein
MRIFLSLCIYKFIYKSKCVYGIYIDRYIHIYKCKYVYVYVHVRQQLEYTLKSKIVKKKRDETL